MPLADLFANAAPGGPTPEFQAGQGTPQALPYGQATQMNQQAQAAQSASPPAVDTAAPPPSETAGQPAAGASPQPGEPPWTPQNEMQQFILGPTQEPHKQLAPVYTQPPRPGYEPWVEALAAEASDPNASEDLKDKFREVMAWINRTRA